MSKKNETKKPKRLRGKNGRYVAKTNDKPIIDNLGDYAINGGPGRPPGSVSLVMKLKKQLREHPENADKIVDKWIKDAMKGDDRARASIIDRIEGKVPDMTIIIQKIEVDVIHKIGAMLPQAMQQAGVGKKQVNESLGNFQRLLEAEE